jgi:hypothetical protein
MASVKTSDCTACANLRTHPNPSQPFHHWKCAKYGLCVGTTVLKCEGFRRRTTGECPPKADAQAFVWSPAIPD